MACVPAHRFSCVRLCDPVDFSPPGSSVQGISQARILEWVAVPSSRGSSQPRDQIQVVFIAGRFFIAEPLGKEDNSKPGFLNLCTIDTLGQITLCWGWGAVQHCSPLDPQNASVTFSSYPSSNQKMLNVPWKEMGTKFPSSLPCEALLL